jgi:Berberine and berberine like
MGTRLLPGANPYTEPGGYINFMQDNDYDKIQDNYRQNYDRLVQVKRAYDPGNLFHINQNIMHARQTRRRIRTLVPLREAGRAAPRAGACRREPARQRPPGRPGRSLLAQEPSPVCARPASHRRLAARRRGAAARGRGPAGQMDTGWGPVPDVRSRGPADRCGGHPGRMDSDRNRAPRRPGHGPAARSRVPLRQMDTARRP